MAKVKAKDTEKWLQSARKAPVSYASLLETHVRASRAYAADGYRIHSAPLSAPDYSPDEHRTRQMVYMLEVELKADHALTACVNQRQLLAAITAALKYKDARYKDYGYILFKKNSMNVLVCSGSNRIGLATEDIEGTATVQHNAVLEVNLRYLKDALAGFNDCDHVYLRVRYEDAPLIVTSTLNKYDPLNPTLYDERVAMLMLTRYGLRFNTADLAV